MEREYTNGEVYRLLCRIDQGYEPTEEEARMLSEREGLYLHNKKLTYIPGAIERLVNLKTLVLTGDPITALPETLGSLSRLQRLFLQFTQITSLPGAIGQLSGLQMMNLSFTPITALPVSLALGHLPIYDRIDGANLGIYAAYTRLPSVYFEGREVLERYFAADEKRGFREAKIIFLGDGNAGKTFTVRRFLKNGAREDPNEPYSTGQTHGVMVYDYPHRTKNGEDFTVHLWDFGGQEMLHAMHRCFLTENTVYVLMVSTRDSEHTRRLRYWLRSIRAFARGETVWIIVNVFDNTGAADIDALGLQNEFKEDFSLRFLRLSVKDAEPDAFRAQIITPLLQNAEEAETAAGLHPLTYMHIKDRVKAALRSTRGSTGAAQGWIGSDAYLNACIAERIENPREQAALLRYFTNLGVCFSDVRQEDDVVSAHCRLIEPVWLTNALYAIIEECEPVRGWVTRSDIRLCLGSEMSPECKKNYVRLLPEQRYSREDCEYVLRIAEQNSLAFLDKDDKNAVFFPTMCHYEDKDFRTLNADDLKKHGLTPKDLIRPEKPAYHVVLELEFPNLPGSTVQRLMLACLRAGFQRPLCWRGGFRFQSEFCAGIVDTVGDDRIMRLDFWSTKEQSALYDRLEWFRERLRESCSSREEPEEFICVGKERYSVRRLLHAKYHRISKVPKTYDRELFEVAELLGMFPESAALRTQPEKEPELNWYRFRTNFPDNPQKDFERLCRDLFRLEFFDGEYVLKSSPNNAGVEVEPQKCRKRNGDAISFQAKFFTGTNYDSILKSAEMTVEHYSGAIKEVLLFCNNDMSKKSGTYQESKQILENAGITLTPITDAELLAMIKNHPRIVQEYFHT